MRAEQITRCRRAHMVVRRDGASCRLTNCWREGLRQCRANMWFRFILRLKWYSFSLVNGLLALGAGRTHRSTQVLGWCTAYSPTSSDGHVRHHLTLFISSYVFGIWTKKNPVASFGCRHGIRQREASSFGLCGRKKLGSRCRFPDRTNPNPFKK
jgi:hypothetical protein